ncbi:MAG: hypothetical protein K8F91_00620, partial [Candidatus Obscuribacterales bacterium]|nr:hypothetical protein [Candidatus Obscuribacterales bacterium]
TTQKAEKILQEIGVKGVKMKAGVLETSGEFGMTVNTSPGTDRIGSAGHQAQVKMGAANPETYVSETGGAVRSKVLKDDIATLDHYKKAKHGLTEKPNSLVGGSAEGQAMAKGAMKAAGQAGLDQDAVTAIARKHGIKNPENVMDRLAEIKANRSTISSADEAAKLQGASRDILEASRSATNAKATSQIKSMEAQITELKAAGKTAQSHQMQRELKDYRAKVNAASEVIGVEGAAVKSGRNTGSTTSLAEREPKPTTGSKLVKGAGLVLGVYGIYEGYQRAKEEMEQKKAAEPGDLTGWSARKAELAARTAWHGLGFGAAAEAGEKAGREAYEQYKADIASGKISPDSWKSYLGMKSKAVAGAFFGIAKGMTYDAAWQTGTSVGIAGKEGVGAGQSIYDWIKSNRAEKATNEERANQIYDKLIKEGASSVGAQRAADLVRKGDFSEAKRLSKILDAKKAEKLASAEPLSRPRTWRERKKKEKSKAATVKSQPVEASTDEDTKRREIVLAKLNGRGLPTGTALVDRLVSILEKDGMSALDSAINEITGMQGNFQGSLGGRGRLVITVRGTNATGRWLHVVTNSVGKAQISTRSEATLKGDVDLAAGSISMILTGRVTNPGFGEYLRPTNIAIHPTRMIGRFTGRGYKGQYGGSMPWSVQASQ